MKKLLLATLYLIGLCGYAQSPISYQVSLDNIVHHELRISVTFQEVPAGAFLVKMSDTSPGRYAEHQFAKNVYGEAAYDQQGNALPIRRASVDSWEVTPSDGFVRFEYRLYANHADGTYAGVDARKLLLNAPATFVYADGMDAREVLVNFDLSNNPSWSVATQLQEVTKSTYRAPNPYYFFDSPIMIGEIDFRSWEVDGKTIRIAMLHEGTDEELDQYAEWTKGIVLQEKAVFGSLPDYDFGTYTFLCAYNPWVKWDGMEHRNSTVCSAPLPLKNFAPRLIGTIAHEFFHGWNIERIRPDDLEPFDFDEPNMSEALWFGEGFTNYYDMLIQCRTGLISRVEYLENLESRVNQIRSAPARQFRNPIQISQNAPFSDAAVSNDETNYANNYVSYYYYGEVLAAGLDLMLRTSFKDVTLDTYMARVWDTYGKTEIPYTLTDLKQTLAELTESPEFAEQFFNDYIYKSNLPDYPKMLAEFGVATTPKQAGNVYWGSPTLKNGLLTSASVIGTPFYDGGVEKGDIIVTVDRRKVQQASDLTALNLIPGKEYEIEFVQMGINKKGRFVATEDPDWTFSLSTAPSKKQQAKLESWLAPK